MSTKVNLSEASARKIRRATLLTKLPEEGGLGGGIPGGGIPGDGIPGDGILDKVKFRGTHFQTKFIF